MSTDRPDIGADYRRCRERLSDLLLSGPPSVWAQPVPACPGWDVAAVVSHIVGNIEDGMAGRLTGGPPDDTQSADQVARHAGQSMEELVGNWAELAPVFEPIVTEAQIYPVVLDLLSHEHDIRGAIGVPGDRDEALVQMAARRLVSGLELPVNLEFDVGDVIATVAVDGPTHRVTTTPFEVFRLRLGRRSPEQVAALPWDTVPVPVIDELFIFGPRATPLVE